MSETKQVPARLHVLLAKDSPMAVLVRRGPSLQTAAIGWNRADDSFTLGQWFKGRIYHFRSDISPDGKHWIYFAMSKLARTYTVVAKTPYLKALDFYPKGDAWNGGGLFTSNRDYWLNTGPFAYGIPKKTSKFSVQDKWLGKDDEQGECPGVYFRRLQRDGWTHLSWTQPGAEHSVWRFEKRINEHWNLIKLFNAKWPSKPGQGIYFEEHLLQHKKTAQEITFPDWEWADIDGARLLWAEKGLIMQGRVSKNGLEGKKMLFDANPLSFEQIKAPY